MPFNHTSFKVGDYEVCATFSGRSDPLIMRKVQEILLSSFVGAAKGSLNDSLADISEKQYNVGGG